MAATPEPPSKPAVRKRKKRLRWTPTPYTKAGLMRIQKLGIFGDDTSQIVNHLIGEELRRLLASHLLDQKELDQAVDSLPADEKEPPPKLDEED
jgi:hypothetical protein